MSKPNAKQIAIGLSVATIASLILFKLYKDSQEQASVNKRARDKSRSLNQSDTPLDGTLSKSVSTEAKTPLTSNASGGSEKALHMQIEELDKKGKLFFKEKQYLKAADIFTKALDLIENNGGSGQSTSLARQVVTLTNNRSAMYEKGGVPDLALADCSSILEQEPHHNKARTRSLRILESQGKFSEALVQICALQLKFMKENQAQLRMGIPVQPPVPQQKLEDMVQKMLPAEVEKYMEMAKNKTERPLPSQYTLTQLLKSFSGYNAWMAQAAKSGSVQTLSNLLEKSQDQEKQASLYLKRGCRHVHDKNYETACSEFETALALVEDKPELQDKMENDDYARLLEWTGMGRHWKYDLDGALKAYEKCNDLEPTNANVIVKRAGVKMDAGSHEEALELFDTAIGLDPAATDALLHRANLRLLQQKVDEAKTDLLACLKLRPDHLLARLRLATILMATNDTEGTMQQLEKADQMAPNSSEVHSYRGEMHFARGELDEAKVEFEKAIECEPLNPTPYVNAALAIMNTPAAGSIPDTAGAIEKLEKAIEVDPQMHSAYMHLGQLRLAMASDLTIARSVISLYDRALENCRTPDEIRDICGVRLLTVAQVDAAVMLGMETFSVQ
mmetsp:Transcript_4571/g.6592  ORF Transcript_4571/g.6592 Transcript_4571/m.6592 type:complete len:618 (+) Transcript_4571:109-1962(+)|eukprot:CAMPEP_0194224472 /NCGR_PEP_ID=MMETSP0156-20130528/37534_1 /TAXON_ID=33649 /ORGANISM="Thalassionema nitzschioides, Strain L26-B" /LENGTH=617 /DNA_ID=CAMNT_0038956053 /DNA_START=62 /DNA_END=1915 /DNA_ORIENTATION=-